VHHVAAVHVVVQGLLDEVLRFVSREVSHPRVQEDELQVQAGPKHEHVAVQLDFCDSAGGQRVAHCHQPHVLQARVVGGRVQREGLHLQVAGAVNDLSSERMTAPLFYLSTSCQHTAEGDVRCRVGCGLIWLRIRSRAVLQHVLKRS